jgi:hypothetical protein
MVSPAVLLLLNLIHIILGTFAVTFLALTLSSIQEATATTPELVPSRDLLLAAVVLAGVAWIISIIIGPLAAIAAKKGYTYPVRVSAGFAFIAFVFYAVAGSIAAYVYSVGYQDLFLAGAIGLLLISAILLIAFGSSAIVLVHAVKVFVIETIPSTAVITPVVTLETQPIDGTLESLRPA